MTISNESMNFKDPKESGDPQLFDDPKVFNDPQLFNNPQLLHDQLEVWTLIIQKSTLIPPSLMVLFYFESFTKRSNLVIVSEKLDLSQDSDPERQ